MNTQMGACIAFSVVRPLFGRLLLHPTLRLFALQQPVDGAPPPRHLTIRGLLQQRGIKPPQRVHLLIQKGKGGGVERLSVVNFWVEK